MGDNPVDRLKKLFDIFHQYFFQQFLAIERQSFHKPSLFNLFRKYDYLKVAKSYADLSAAALLVVLELEDNAERYESAGLSEPCESLRIAYGTYRVVLAARGESLNVLHLRSQGARIPSKVLDGLNDSAMSCFRNLLDFMHSLDDDFRPLFN